MITNLTKQDLIDFEEDIANCFNNKMIKAPIHLYYGCEDQFLEVFKDIKEEDWVFSDWRSHYQALLKGVDPKKLRQDIINGRSMSLTYKEQKMYCSAIVTGQLSVAVGTAMDIKRKGGTEKVWCFVGDMTSCSGVFHESLTYSNNHNLPIIFVIEDNDLSVVTETRKTWNTTHLPYEPRFINEPTTDWNGIWNNGVYKCMNENLYYFRYERKVYEHARIWSKDTILI